MPCATIHMLTAGRVLDAWCDRAGHAPFPVDAEELRDAFLLGAMGPDMGFVPGVDRFVSELSHYVSTGDLTRTLLDRAATPRQEAFAWGWATHHVTDVEIHPLVGRACGERLRGDRELRLNSSDDLPTHVGIEVGLDLHFLRSDPRIPRPPTRPLLDPVELGFLVDALEETYGLEWERPTIARDYRIAVRQTARWPRVITLLARARGFGRDGSGSDRLLPRLGRGVLDAAAYLAGASSAAAGLFRPLHPPGWVVERVRRVAEVFPERFQTLVQDRLRSIENRNLETGLLEGEPVDHPDSERTFRRLRALHEDGGRP
ncbi:MAG: hypothetical protein GWM92_08645 [Gemmatimonadetes bacterium]|nr:zinc dependent phospholipase C family protein [Gemmatimonadota bacterium]NIR78704.1 zinc dependent phospholipase C family protein [Gemmatimonadota bacterium]NIT87343.1 zinc dependent phospholipase C family protein [Gemmatimonadota bacterium]NIU31187.1 zinc dependent phospholipase C family protein [Gemmatimonadota bacterium]NIU35909.1 hypothetical protein [Gemmatimonadota bacterium]